MDSPSDHLICTEAGKGPALVLIHGYLGSARHWDLQVPLLARRFRCISPNLAGFGDSAQLTAPESIGGHAAQVLATLDRLGVERFHLLGHSMGGMIAQEMTARAPDRIDRLILYGTGPVGLLPDRFETIDTSRQRLLNEGLDATARRIAATWFEAGEDAVGYAVCLAEAKRASLQAALASLTAWEGWDGRAELTSFAAPSLVIWGDSDRSYGWPQPQRLWHSIPDCRLAVVPCCGHAVHMENPAIFNSMLEDFLDKCT